MKTITLHDGKYISLETLIKYLKIKKSQSETLSDEKCLYLLIIDIQNETL